MTASEDIQFYTRHAWVHFKSLLHVPLEADWNHICDMVSRAARAGKIAKGSALTSTTRKDGFGSQALCRLSIKAAARELGLDYVHSPFKEIAHAEGDPAAWVDRCERVLSLGEGVPQIGDVGLPVVHGLKLPANPQVARTPHVIVMRNMLAFCNRSPEIYGAITGNRAPSPLAVDKPVTIAVHIRRGDISSRAKHRYTSESVTVHSVRQVQSLLEAEGFKYTTNIYTDAAPGELKQIEELGWIVRRDGGALEAFDQMRNADILFTAKSMFSYLAAIYNPNIVIYENYSHRPLPHWIASKSDGTFSVDALQRQVRALAS